MPWVYIVKCSDGFYYTGSAVDLEHRIAEHQAGTYCGFTSVRRPVKLVFAQETATHDEAFQFEQHIKGWSRKKKEALMAGDFELLRALSRNKSEVREGD